MKESKKYFIPVNGELCETNEMVYKAYYKMDRRERYLEERSKKHELSYEALVDGDYPVEEKMNEKDNSVDDVAITTILIEKMLLVISNLSEEERWLIQELFFYGKNECRIAEEIGVSRRTIGYRKNNILYKLKELLKN